MGREIYPRSQMQTSYQSQPICSTSITTLFLYRTARAFIRRSCSGLRFDVSLNNIGVLKTNLVKPGGLSATIGWLGLDLFLLSLNNVSRANKRITQVLNNQEELCFNNT